MPTVQEQAARELQRRAAIRELENRRKLALLPADVYQPNTAGPDPSMPPMDTTAGGIDEEATNKTQISAAPERGMLSRAAGAIKEDPLKAVAGVVTNTVGKSLSFALEPAWAAFKRTRPDDVDPDVKDMTLSQAVDFYGGRDPSMAENLVSGIASFALPAGAIGKGLSKAAPLAKSAGKIGNAARTALTWGVASALQEAAKGVAQKIDPDTEYGYEGALGAAKTAATGAAVGAIGATGLPLPAKKLAESVVFGGQTAIEGGSPTDILISAGIPLVLSGQDIAREIRAKNGATVISKSAQSYEAPKSTTTEPPPKAPRPPKMNQLKHDVHKLAKQGKLSTDEYRNRLEQVTGVRSVKNMSRSGLEAIKQQFEADYGVLNPKTPVMVDGVPTTVEAVLSEATQTVASLPSKTRRTQKVKLATGPEQSLVQRVGSVLWGKKNHPKYLLAKELDGGKEDGVYSRVLDKNIERGRVVEADMIQVCDAMLRRDIKAAGITNADLTRMSRAANPRLKTQERLSPKTEIVTVKINNKQYDTTWARLADIYLVTGQKSGRKHAVNGGLKMSNKFTGPIPEGELDAIRAKVEANPKAKAIADSMLRITNGVHKKGINQVSYETQGKNIATEDNWWHEEVWKPRKVVGRQKAYKVSFIENQSILKPRKGGKGPLVVRDVFERFNAINAGTAEYVGMAQPFQMARTLLDHTGKQQTLYDKGYRDTHDTLVTLFSRIQGSEKSAGGEIGIAKSIRQSWYRAVLHYSPHIWAAQGTSVLNYGSYVSPEYMKHMFSGMSRKAIKETLAKSSIAYDRYYSGGAGLEMGEAMQSDATYRMLTKKSSYKNKPSIMLRTPDAGALSSGRIMAEAELADARAGTIRGRSAKWWKSQDLTRNSDALMLDRAHYLWQRSQPSWGKYNRSWMTSHPNQLLRSTWLFRSFHEKVLTIWTDAKMDYSNSPKKFSDGVEFSERVAWPIASYTVNAAIKAAITTAVAREVKKPIEYVLDIITSPLSAFPFMGPVITDGVKRFTRAATDSKQTLTYNVLESPMLTLGNDALRSIPMFGQAAGESVSGDGKKAEVVLKRAIATALMPIGLSLGIPMYQLRKAYKGWIEPEDKPEQQRIGR